MSTISQDCYHEEKCTHHRYPTMLGNFQRSELRIEVSATASKIRDVLLSPPALTKWLFPQQMSFPNRDLLSVGTKYRSIFGPVVVEYIVDRVDTQCLRLLLSNSIDGYHEWYWGEGWVQSRIEGISLIPLNLHQTTTLLRLRQALK